MDLPKPIRNELIAASIKFMPTTTTNSVKSTVLYRTDNITVETLDDMIEFTNQSGLKMTNETLVLLNMLRDDPTPDLLIQLNAFERLELIHNSIVMLCVDLKNPTGYGYMTQIDLSIVLSRLAAEKRAKVAMLMCGLLSVVAFVMYLRFKY